MLKINTYRADIKHDLKSSNQIQLANIIRIFNYENKKYELINDTLLDIEGLFLSSNSIMSIDNDYITIDNTKISYNVLESEYINRIPLWESLSCNAKKYPDLYNDGKWVIGKREEKRKHHKLLKLENGFLFKVGFLWKHQPFDQRPTYNVNGNKKFVKTFKALDTNNTILEDDNWGAILAKTQQYIKDNANYYYKNYEKSITIQGYCKSEDVWFDIVKFNVLKNIWF